MTHLVEHEVGDVHDIVDRALADGHQPLLEPVGRRVYLHVLQGNADIAGRQVGCLDDHRNGLSCAGNKRAHVGQRPRHGDVVLHAIRIQVARHANVAGAVHAVRRQADFEERVFLQLQLRAGRRADDGTGIEHHDARVVISDAELVFRADHAVALDAADLGFLDLEFRAVVGREFCPDGSHQDLLALRHVGGAADHLQQLRRSRVEFGDVQVVGIGMRHAFHHFRHDDASQAAGNLFDGLHVFNFQSRRCQDGADLLRRQVELQIILQPIE